MSQLATRSYLTVDSNHPGYVLRRSYWVTPAFLATFALASAAVFLAMPDLIRQYAALLRTLTGVGDQSLPTPATLSFRPFFVLVLVLFSAFVAAPLLPRLLLIAVSAVVICGTVVGLDVLLITLQDHGGPTPFSFAGNVLNGFSSLFACAAVVFSSHHTPPLLAVPRQRQRSPRYLVRILVVLGVAAALVATLLAYAAEHIDRARDFAILGGLGPGIVLLFPTVTVLLFAAAGLEKGVRALTRTQANEDESNWLDDPPSVAFLVPAHNEENVITECLLSIDRACRSYPRLPHVYVINNASTDGTADAARVAFELCQWVTGEVVDCPTPGKSRALNLGLSRITEAIVVRVDSDSLLTEDVLPRVIQHFQDPSVGGVGGLSLPFPEQADSLMGRVRSIEVYHNVGLVRVGQDVIDAVMVLPGQMSAYRTDLIRDLGGFAEGINGEDTDLTVRVGRAGWRVVMDPGIRLYSELPEDLAHLHEQRLRWSRSLVHVYKRNLSALWRFQGARGLWLLPMGLVGGIRRASLPLFVIYALLSIVLAPTTLFVRDGMAIVALLSGPQAVIGILALLVYRRVDLVPYFPGYLALRVFRSYVMLEALLMMRHRSLPGGEAPTPVTSYEESIAPAASPAREGARALIAAAMLAVVGSGALLLTG